MDANTMEKKASFKYHFTAASYPASYRQREAAIIVQKIRARESLLISSLAGSGKTHLMQFLVANQGFKQRYFSDRSEQFRFVLFDCNAVIPDAVGFFRMLIAELVVQTGLEIENHLRSQSLEGLIVITKECLNQLYSDDLTLVCVFDRFEKLLVNPHLPDILDTLRSLRDYFGRRISYIIAGRGVQNIHHLSQEFDDLLGAFDDLLLAPPVLYLGPLSQADAELSVTLYAKERGGVFDAVSRAWVIRLSGGHPRLLRALCEIWRQDWSTATADEAFIVEEALRSRRVSDACQALWEDISLSDQQVLQRLAAAELVQDIGGLLLQQGLVQVDAAGQLRLFCPIFAAFVRIRGKPIFTFELNPPSSVRIGAARIYLTPQEYRFVEALWKTPGDVVLNDDILAAIYPEETRFARELPGLVRRVRSKINVIPSHEFIVNVRGVGYLLDVRLHTAGQPT
jgi:hypothetical protein